MTDYAEFLKQKIKMASYKGHTVLPGDLHPILYPHQRDIVQWAVQGGIRARMAGLSKKVTA